MKTILIIVLLLFSAERLAWAAAAQAIQKQRIVQQEVIDQAIVEQQIAAHIQQQIALDMITQAQRELAGQIAQQMAYRAAQQSFEQAAQNGIDVEQEVMVTATFDTPRASPTGEEYVVEMAEVLKSLETSSEAWLLILDKEPKGFIIAKYIEYFKDQGALIQKPVEEYIDLIDGLAAQQPELLKNPFKDIFEFVAILEYDFDNGQDQEAMIVNLVGQDIYLENKKRLGLL